MIDEEITQYLTTIADQAAEKAADKAAENAVRRILLEMGVDMRDPIQSQREFLTLRDLTTMMTDAEFQKDLIHLRRWRKAMDTVAHKGFMATIGLLALGILGIILYAVQGKFGGN